MRSGSVSPLPSEDGDWSVEMRRWTRWLSWRCRQLFCRHSCCCSFFWPWRVPRLSTVWCSPPPSPRLRLRPQKNVWRHYLRTPEWGMVWYT